MPFDATKAKSKIENTPAARFIGALHRGEDSYVTFHRKLRDDNFENLFSLHVASLERTFARHSDELKEDAFVSINGFWNAELKKQTPRREIPGAHSRRVKWATYLNACYVDIDCYKQGLTAGKVYALVQDMVKQGELPRPSFATQGRGLWLFWLLHDENDPTRPPDAKLHSGGYKVIQRAIGKRLANVGADAAARDSARLTRIPGTYHSKGQCRVKLLWPEKGAPVSYSLEQLRLALGVTKADMLNADRDRIRKAAFETLYRWDMMPSGKVPKELKGWAYVNQHRVNQFRALERLRSGFSEGGRNNAAFVYARLLATTLRSQSWIHKKVSKLAERCDPPLTPSAIEGAVKSGTSPGYRGITTERISELLDITADEHAGLKDMFGRRAWKPAHNNKVLSRAEERRKAIVKLTSRAGILPSRQMAARLKELGFAVSATQVRKDYKALGLNPRSARGK